MMFLQPWMIWGLPLVFLPVLIHMLNRLRYRSITWGAMMFLISAARSSVRRARLRHYLLLVLRTLALALLLLALLRPLAGGWMGLVAGGSPDTVVVILDRSASMEATDPTSRKTKRQRAIELLAQAGGQMRRAGRFVFLETALRKPQELGTLAALESLSAVAATDTAADMPAALKCAIDHIIASQCGQTEIWVASDLQRSNWRPDSSEWKSISASIEALPQDVRVRVLALCDTYGRNTAVSLRDTRRLNVNGVQQIGIETVFSSIMGQAQTMPLVLTLDGARSQSEVRIAPGTQRESRKLALSAGKKGGGWGKIEMPADENMHDNVCFFVYSDEVAMNAALVCEDEKAGRILRFAAAPAPGRMRQTCETFKPAETARLAAGNASLLIWQAEIFDAAWKDVELFVKNGGVALFFPPGRTNAPGPAGIRWGAIQNAEARSPYRVAVWDRDDGPLAKTESGQDLPVSRLALLKRQELRMEKENSESAGAENGEWITVATCADGAPFLATRRMGKGRVFACSTLPRGDWSNLQDGRVLVPMVQRLLAAGSARLGNAVNDVCGEWQPPPDRQELTNVDAGAEKNYLCDAGIYRYGGTLVALNIPDTEMDAESMDASNVKDVFGEVKVEVVQEFARNSRDAAQREMWSAFLVAALLCFIVESALAAGERFSRPKQVERGRAAD